MAVFKIKTKNKIDIEKKPRVYFTCHPDDFEKHFNKICDDIFKTHDCAIYYTEDLNEKIPDDEKVMDLGRNNLLVVPVTLKLLTSTNRAMDEDIPYALEMHMPILPIVMEPGLDEFYSKLDKFGELQYLNAYSFDLTEIPYEQKLKKHLDLVLNNNEFFNRICEAFANHLFLSYRKKDRKYANELISIIHSNPECRSTAIWFDEFLNPGESFSENIKINLNNSDLFVLLVTPNLLEETNGIPNYVLREEYPYALDLGVSILPAEMEKTNVDELSMKFASLPECVNPIEESEKFREQLLKLLSTKLNSKNDNIDENNFFIGLAYIDGIGVEINHRYGIELVNNAAESNVPAAMKKMYKIFCAGIGVKADYNKARKWAIKIIEYNIQKYGKTHDETLDSINDLAYTYLKQKQYDKAVEYYDVVYKIRKKRLGQEDPIILIEELDNLAFCHMKLKNYKKAIELYELVFSICYDFYGYKSIGVIDALGNLARCYSYLDEYNESLDMYIKAYKLQCELLGEKDISSINTLFNIAKVYEYTKDYVNAEKTYRNAYLMHIEVYGATHIYTHIILNQFAFLLLQMKKYEEALEAYNKLYIEKVKTYGKHNPMTISILPSIAGVYRSLNKYDEALAKYTEAYELYKETEGDEHPDVIRVLGDLAFTYFHANDIKKAYELCLETLRLQKKVLGEDHVDLIVTSKMLELIKSELDSTS